MSEMDLARAVLLQAIWDATSSRTSRFPGHKRPRKKDKVEARRFLCGQGSYRVFLKLWCEMAGIKTESVVKFGEKIKKGGKNDR